MTSGFTTLGAAAATEMTVHRLASVLSSLAVGAGLLAALTVSAIAVRERRSGIRLLREQGLTPTAARRWYWSQDATGWAVVAVGAAVAYGLTREWWPLLTPVALLAAALVRGALPSSRRSRPIERSNIAADAAAVRTPLSPVALAARAARRDPALLLVRAASLGLLTTATALGVVVLLSATTRAQLTQLGALVTARALPLALAMLALTAAAGWVMAHANARALGGREEVRTRTLRASCGWSARETVSAIVAEQVLATALATIPCAALLALALTGAPRTAAAVAASTAAVCLVALTIVTVHGRTRGVRHG